MIGSFYIGAESYGMGSRLVSEDIVRTLTPWSSTGAELLLLLLLPLLLIAFVLVSVPLQ